MFWVVGWSADFADPALARVLQHLSLTEHNESFAKGVFETKDVIFYVNFTLVALFLALRSLQARRWKGWAGAASRRLRGLSRADRAAGGRAPALPAARA